MKKGLSQLLVIGAIVLIAVIALVAFLAKNFILGGGYHSVQGGLQGTVIEHMLPKTDVVSEDVSGTSKYDDTIRVVYSHDNCSEESIYYKKGNIVDDAYNYYKNDLTSKGWQIASETNIASLPVQFQGTEVTVKNIKQMTLEKGDYQIEVAVGIVEINGETYTVIHVGKDNLNCEESSGSQTGSNSQSENQVNYDQLQEIHVSGFQADIQNIFQPMINRAFGDSKLVDAEMVQNFYYQKYYVKNEPTSDGINNFVNDLEDASYTILMQGISSDDNNYKIMALGSINGEQYMVAFSISEDLKPGVIEITVGTPQ